MKFLEALKKGGGTPKKSIIPPEHKMREGNRADQQAKMNPEDLVSSPTRALGKSSTKVPSPTRVDVIALAKDLSVDLASVKGTGKDGEITEKDVRTAAREKM